MSALSPPTMSAAPHSRSVTRAATQPRGLRQPERPWREDADYLTGRQGDRELSRCPRLAHLRPSQLPRRRLLTAPKWTSVAGATRHPPSAFAPFSMRKMALVRG